jgi:phage terminase Nu1 subunit (DNA packaging protein)
MSSDMYANAGGPAPERYVDRRELAMLMGVNVRTIDRMVRDGMPSESWGLRARRFRPSLALAWARTRGAGADERRSAA